MSASVVPSEITVVLDQLRGRIRRYIWIEGLALVVALMGGLFWFSFTADVAWFEISKLELPLWFRRSFATLAFGLVAAALLTWLVFRLRRSFQHKALALVLEKHFPQLDDRLVTAVELAGDGRIERDATARAMWQRTVSDAAAAVRQLDLTSVFDSRPLRRALLAAVVMAVSVLGLGVANASAMRRWFDAYVIGRENYWDPYRRSEMSVQIIAQPGDRVREFDAEHRYKHARGADLTLLVTVADGKEVPPQVTLRHRSFGASGSSRGSVTMSRVGERQFRHTLGRVIDSHELWIVGGDFTNRTPFQIEVVDPPKVERIELQADYPSYTGMDSLEDQPVLVQGPRVSLPMETRFVLQARANKPLKAVQVRTERWQLDLSLSGESALTLNDSTSGESRRLALPSDAAGAFLPGNSRGLHLPLQLSQQSGAKWDEQWRSLIAGSAFDLPNPIPLPPDQLMQIYLEDADEILSFDPATVSINAVPDTPPAVDVRLTGIGQRITRLAMIPVQGRLADDYGVMEAWFRYQRPGDEQALTAPLQNPPNGKLSLELERQPGDKTERFDVLPLQMEVGQRLNVSLHARDGDTFNGPHETSGPAFSFEIVSDDAVLSDLYDKEMNLRLRFEHIREEVDALRTDLLLHRGRYTDGVKLRAAPVDESRPAAETQEELRQIGVAVQACADRSLHLVRKSHAECREVEFRFEDIREELVNNRVDTPDKLTRLDQGILSPLADLNSREFPRGDEQLGLFGLTLERELDPTGVIDDTVLTLDRMLVKMDRILDQMQQRRGFNEAIQELQGLLERQKQILDATEQERQRSLIDDLFK